MFLYRKLLYNDEERRDSMFSTIDLHGCTRQEAKVQLDHYIDSLSSSPHEVTVIHGYSSTVLKNFVQKQYHHQRLKRKILTLNQGETILVIQ